MTEYAVTDTVNLFVKRRGGEDFVNSSDFDSGTETVHTMNGGAKLIAGKKRWEHKVVSGDYVLLSGAEITAALAAGAQAENRFDPINSATISAGVVTVDLTAKENWEIVMTENVSTLTLVTPPGMFATALLKIKQDGTGGRTFSFSGHTFASGTATDISTLGADEWVWLEIISDGTDVTFSEKNTPSSGGAGGAGKKLKMFHRWNKTSGTETFLPWGHENEVATLTDDDARVFLPAAYRLLTVTAWSTTAGGSTDVSLHINNNATAQAEVNVDMVSNDTPYTFDFTAASNLTVAGEFVAVAFNPLTTPNSGYAWSVWEEA